MKYALIATNENNRICQVEVTQFPVASPLVWVECQDSVTPLWTYDGEQFVEPQAPPAPRVVTMRQARLALLQAGLLTSVDSAINALSEPQKSAAKVEWEYATEVSRDSSLVTSLSAALNLTNESLDALFTSAQTF